jgi:hypothetical protein
MSDEMGERDRNSGRNRPDSPETSGQFDEGEHRDDLTDAEKAALHEMQVGIEHVGRARGRLLDFHHELGNASDHFESAREALREAGHDELADELRDRHLPAGVIGDRWTYELVTEFEEGFRADVTTFERDLRETMAGGEDHVTEQEMQSQWRERAETEAWKTTPDQDGNGGGSDRDGTVGISDRDETAEDPDRDETAGDPDREG